MDRDRRARAVHALLSTLVVTAIVVPDRAQPLRRGATISPLQASLSPGADIPALDTDTARYSLQSDGLTRLQLYNSPVGYPDAHGWRLRNPTLRTAPGTHMAAPANLPFALHVATTGDAATLATITNEDGVRLGVGLAAIDGVPATTVAGQASDGAITYTAVVAPALPAPGLGLPAGSDSGTHARFVAGSADRAPPCLDGPCIGSRLHTATPTIPPAGLTTPVGTPGTIARPSPTETLTPTATDTPTPLPGTSTTATPTVTLTSTTTATAAGTPTITATASVTAEITVTATASATATQLLTVTASATATLLLTATATVTGTAATTPTSGSTITAVASATPTPPVTPTASATSTPSATATAGATTPVTATPVTTPAPVDLALQPTIEGLDLRVVVHGPGEGQSIVFALAPDSGTHVVQDSSSAIRIIRPIAGRSDGGSPYVVDGPEYVVQRPLVRDSARDPASLVLSGPLTVTLGNGLGGELNLTVRLDPAWLADPRRVFPVRLDLPIVTAWAALHTGVLTTVSSCAPATLAGPAALVVGVDGGCTFHGQLRFDLSSLMNDTPIVAATLHLYTPDRSGPTGVQVYANAPGAVASVAPVSWQPPSWDHAPPLAAGSPGRGQNGANGPWQSWDVTDLVQSWVRDGKTNSGLTLASGGSPVLFSSPLDVEGTDPSTAPYLDITYASRPALSATYGDGAPYVYGVAGTFAAASSAGYPTPCSTTTGVCTETNGRGGTESVYEVNQAVAGAGSTPDGPGGGYLRLGVTLSCASANPGSAWWNSSDQKPFAPGPVDADRYNIGSVLDILRNVAAIDNAAGNVDALIPILEFSYNPACPQYSTPGSWYSQMKDFVQTMNASAYGAYRPIYFEIGNEVDFGTNATYMGGGPSGYASVFAAAAQGVSEAMQAIAGAAAHERTITAGMLQPSVTDAAGICTTPQTGIVNVQEAQLAVNAARQNLQSHGLPVALGVAVHPYAYTTNGTYYWRNLAYYGLGYNQNACFDLRQMLGLWVNTYFPGLPVVFTEINVSTFPCAQGTSGCASTCHNPPWVGGDAVANCEGAYLADLYTYLYDNPATGSGSYADARNSPVRVAWFRGNDAGDGLGLAYGGGTVKPVTIRGLTDPSGQPYCINSPVIGNRDMPHDYYWLRFGACY